MDQPQLQPSSKHYHQELVGVCADDQSCLKFRSTTTKREWQRFMVILIKRNVEAVDDGGQDCTELLAFTGKRVFSQVKYSYLAAQG